MKGFLGWNFKSLTELPCPIRAFLYIDLKGTIVRIIPLNFAKKKFKKYAKGKWDDNDKVTFYSSNYQNCITVV